MDNATLQRLTTYGDIADLIWEAPADLTAEHGQLLLAAIQAYQAGKRETGERLWQQAQAPWSRHGYLKGTYWAVPGTTMHHQLGRTWPPT